MDTSRENAAVSISTTERSMREQMDTEQLQEFSSLLTAKLSEIMEYKQGTTILEKSISCDVSFDTIKEKPSVILVDIASGVKQLLLGFGEFQSYELGYAISCSGIKVLIMPEFAQHGRLGLKFESTWCITE